MLILKLVLKIAILKSQTIESCIFTAVFFLKNSQNSVKQHFFH